MSLLDIQDISVQFNTDTGVVYAVDHVSLKLEEGESLGLVGETGAGKTTTALAVLRLIQAPPGQYTSGRILFRGEDILAMSPEQIRKIRGNKISMIFQDPMTALNPVMTVGEQIAEGIQNNERCSPAEARAKMLQMLEMVRIPPERANDFPHQFSGGMKQRVVIAIALSCNPALVIADEPTSALDVTIQAQVLAMINELKERQKTSMILITHDLGVVAESCNKVAILYAGEIVEYGTVEDVFRHAAHPYTEGLFHCIPRLDVESDRLETIPGMMPDPSELPEGCKFYPRCAKAVEACRNGRPRPVAVSPGHTVSCFLAKEDA
ncbi:MAG: ABC transporter ATP-binding protein [Oscillospiraceae bacterium]|nr:ABC transporter ATP-binding protein [Oscillospiraceae bacterium]